jgi:hypothetical protein
LTGARAAAEPWLFYNLHSMSGFGGATHGHDWSNHELVESHAFLDINALYQCGGLVPGTETRLQWAEGGPVGSLRATHGQIFLTGSFNQVLPFDWVEVLNGRYERPRWRCPSCQGGAYHLHEKAGVFLCRRCCRYDWRSRHRQRSCPAFARIRRLRKRLNADPNPLAPLPPRPRWRMSRVYYDRLVAQLRCEEALAYDGVERLLDRLERRRGHDRS